jgi:flagellar basal-body rod protein FlgC
MGFLSSLDISASALTAQRLRMDVISENIANVDTTRTANGEPYRRRVAVLSPRTGESFSAYMNNAEGTVGSGVVVSSIETDNSDFKLEYDPEHPDADANGYVRLPNVDVSREMIDMISATRFYEANVTALNATKSMAMKALEIGK